jgi:thymidylate kinase
MAITQSAERLSDSHEVKVVYPLVVYPTLLAVDGPDGSGKSDLSGRIAQRLSELYGADKVVSLDITNLKGSPGQEKLKHVLKEGGVSQTHENRLYAAGVNRAYKELVVPALQAGMIVVLDRSEVDLIRFATESQNEVSLQDRKRYIESGIMTIGYWAGNRIFVSSTAQDIWANLAARGNMTKYDPQIFEEVEKRVNSAIQAEQYITNINANYPVNMIRIQNERQAQPEKIDEYMSQLAQSAVEKLKLD